MTSSGARDPLHGVTLEAIVNRLLATYGWDEMGRRVDIRCFRENPSVRSSLTFLRRTPWARKKVEEWYVASFASGDPTPPPSSLGRR